MDACAADVPAGTTTQMLRRLREDDLRPYGVLANASNNTLLVQVGGGQDTLLGVYKPRDGERPLWDFPSGTLWRREVAAYVVSEFLRWDIVPPTVAREGPLGPGSVQLFVRHDPRQHYFVLVEDHALHPALARIAAFDLVVNNADRKGSHVLLAQDGGIRGIDHGLTFHAAAKLRTVIWDFTGWRVPDGWRKDLERLAAAIASAQHPLVTALSDLLAPTEIARLAARAERVARLSALPHVDEHARPYPWPPL